ncbi:unnamed protein product, partial [Thlaspi arvense]
FFIIDRIVHEYEEAKAKQKIRRTANFEIDVHIMVLMLTLIARINNCSTQIERPIRRAPTQLGYEYLQKAMKEDSQHFRELYQACSQENVASSSNAQEQNQEDDESYSDAEELVGTQEQQREFANNWRATIAANMWGDANDDGYQP